MPHLSRGCLRCRQRRVKCDEGRPSCRRCVARDELCVGYRDDSSLIFHDETTQVICKGRIRAAENSAKLARTRSTSDLSSLAWLNVPSDHPFAAYNNQEAVDSFLGRFVIHPCNESSSPGFLEHLPDLFNHVNRHGRYALRYAVQAAAFADMSSDERNKHAEIKAFENYGKCLAALGQSLSSNGKPPDDYDLMTIVVLDIFEELFLFDKPRHGAHSQGMAHILRLRGNSQFNDPRGWSLFRLAHHRLQKEQLVKELSPLAESQDWLDQVNRNAPFMKVKEHTVEVSWVCKKAKLALNQLLSGTLSQEEMVQILHEMYAMDQEIAQWRQRPEWSYRTISRDETCDEKSARKDLPSEIELHKDIWLAYEWNYHRTARIILHHHLIKCIRNLSNTSQPSGVARSQLIKESTSLIQALAGQVLSTVPQSLGDIDCQGYVNDMQGERPRCQAIGAYFLLWPIRIIKSPSRLSTDSQKRIAQAVFERIRDCTGMKMRLGTMEGFQEDV